MKPLLVLLLLLPAFMCSGADIPIPADANQKAYESARELLVNGKYTEV